ncbi:hypothetical protein U0070_001868 [Myodes glareolus]|uniref:Uncharacterized protein n=1 Tax=Myodes glareolus TaxID=447135 RepID=A0AAW0H599_MYOGA
MSDFQASQNYSETLSQNISKHPNSFPVSCSNALGEGEDTERKGKEGAGMAWALKLPLADEVIESGLVQDFDASLSGIGQELGAGAYSMR